MVGFIKERKNHLRKLHVSSKMMGKQFLKELVQIDGLKLRTLHVAGELDGPRTLESLMRVSLQFFNIITSPVSRSIIINGVTHKCPDANKKVQIVYQDRKIRILDTAGGIYEP